MHSFVSSGGWEGQANFKMSFLSGGAIELGQHLFKLATNGLYAKFCYCVHCPLQCEVMTGSTIFHLKNNLGIQKDTTSFQIVGISDLLGIWFIQARTRGFFSDSCGKNRPCVWVNTPLTSGNFTLSLLKDCVFPPFCFSISCSSCPKWWRLLWLSFTRYDERLWPTSTCSSQLCIFIPGSAEWILPGSSLCCWEHGMSLPNCPCR